MFFLDVKDLIEYSLIDMENMKVVCGEKYFIKQKQDAMLAVCNYENTVINFPYTDFLQKDISNKLSNNAVVVFLKETNELLEKQNKTKTDKNNLNIEIIASDELNAILEKCCDIKVSVNCQKIDSIVKDVLTGLANIYKG